MNIGNITRSRALESRPTTTDNLLVSHYTDQLENPGSIIAIETVISDGVVDSINLLKFPSVASVVNYLSSYKIDNKSSEGRYRNSTGTYYLNILDYSNARDVSKYPDSGRNLISSNIVAPQRYSGARTPVTASLANRPRLSDNLVSRVIVEDFSV
uniref:Uncharacterized protein n=1 Tax=viral metagenome TaxID=1070528 RepID=A0A6C0BMY5_9ZZZZ